MPANYQHSAFNGGCDVVAGAADANVASDVPAVVAATQATKALLETFFSKVKKRKKERRQGSCLCGVCFLRAAVHVHQL